MSKPVCGKDLEFRYHVQKAHNLSPLSLRSVITRRTCNMSINTFHIKICYSTTSNTKAVLVCQVNQSIKSQNTLLFVSYNYYWYIHETTISKIFQIFNSILFPFFIIMSEINMVIMWHWNPLIKLNIIACKLNAWWNINLHKHAITLVLVKTYNFHISILCVWPLFYYRYINYMYFSKLQYKFNDKEKDTIRKLLEEWTFSASSRQLSIQAGVLFIELPFFRTNCFFKLLTCLETPNYCLMYDIW